jgi:hypothetical protein
MPPENQEECNNSLNNVITKALGIYSHKYKFSRYNIYKKTLMGHFLSLIQKRKHLVYLLPNL